MLSKLHSSFARFSLALVVLFSLVGTLLPANPPPVAYALNNGLALKPPLGWNSWNNFGCNVSDVLIRQMADAMVSSGMAAAGYQYVNVDDCWQGVGRTNGHVNLDVDFPNMQGLADYIHSKGLKFGLYSDHGTSTCAGRVGSYSFETTDANDYAAWGVDYLKYDNCNLPPGDNVQQDYVNMKNALAASGRGIVYSICAWNFQSWMPATGNLWRTTGDISDSWGSMIGIYDINVGLTAFASPGAWNDPDMLEIGRTGMTDTEYRTHMSLWSIMAAPLIAGNDLRSMTQATKDILTASEVLAVNQDPLGIQATKVRDDGNSEVLSKKLNGSGIRAVALLNRNTVAANITVSWSEIGLAAGSATVRDLWAKVDRGSFSNSYTVSVPAHGTALLKITGAEGPTPTPVPPPSGDQYVSDLTATLSTNGWGPMEKDKSNGEQAAGDGVTITLNGVTYAKGLGVHAASEVRYNVGANCNTFTASVGVDDEKTTASTIIFQVYGDGALLYDSGVMNPTTATKSVNANIAGKNELKLIVTDAGDGNNSDHADWANAMVHCNGGPAATPTRTNTPVGPTPTRTNTPTGPVSYEAEAGTLAGAAVLQSCPACSGGQKVGFIGNVAANFVTLTVNAGTAGNKTMTIYACVSGTRTFSVSVNGGAAQTVSFTGTSFSTPITQVITVSLNAGNNTIKFYNNTAYAPDLDRITLQ